MRAALETVVLALTCLSPWAFGASEPVFEFMLYAGLAFLLILWGARMLLEGCASLAKCPGALCLSMLLLIGVWQITPLPRGWLVTLSPATADVYDTFLPREREVLADGSAAEAPAWSSGSTLSLYPGVTRRALVQLLAALLLFLIVRNNMASVASLRRLCIVAVVNGVCLALYGLFQYFYFHNLVYGKIRTPGSAFGPFIYRNYFACYLNLCFGLGCGLFLSSGLVRDDRPTRDRRDHPFILEPHTPPTSPLWIGAGCVLMLASIVFCQSRGGILALVLAAGLLLMRWPARWFRGRHIVTALALVTVTVTLLGFLGYHWAGSRLQSVWDGQILSDGRFGIWAQDLPLVRQFPWWGTGFGTFPYVDQPRYARYFYHVVDYAHNEYLEGWIEGGLVSLLVWLTFIAWMVRCGWRAVGEAREPDTSCLAVGALWAFTALAVHCIGDFMLHLPAIAFLAVVLSAQLSALHAPELMGSNGDASPTVQSTRAWRLRLGGLAPLFGAAALTVLGYFLFQEGWKLQRAQRLLFATLPFTFREKPVAGSDKIACLELAAATLPESARLRILLADAYQDAFEATLTSTNPQDRKVADLVNQIVMPFSVLSSFGTMPPAVIASAGLGAEGILSHLRRAEATRAAERYLLPALRNYVHARDLCPLIAKPHVRIAANRRLLQKADHYTVYLERAEQLVPYDARLWYLIGLEHARQGQPEETWRCWKRSLEISNQCFGAILLRSKSMLSYEDILARVLPEKLDMMIGAADLFARDEPEPARLEPFFQKVLALLERQPTPVNADNLHLKAISYHRLGELDKALAAYEDALHADPSQNDWRVEYAVMLYQRARNKEAREQVTTVLRRVPNHAGAKQFMQHMVDNQGR